MSGLTPNEARAIAKDAYIYGFPLVDSYRIQYSYFVDRQSPEFKAPWNAIHNIARVFTPDDKAIQTPNSDTPYSFLGMDLRAEPLVLTIPPIEKDRYFSVQLVDAYNIPTTSTISAAGPPATAAETISSPDRAGPEPHRRASPRSSAPRRNSRSRSTVPSCSALKTSTT